MIMLCTGPVAAPIYIAIKQSASEGPTVPVMFHFGSGADSRSFVLITTRELLLTAAWAVAFTHLNVFQLRINTRPFPVIKHRCCIMSHLS